MCDRIHTPAISDLPVTVELVQYPETYDGPQGDQLARVLSEVASERHRQDERWGGPVNDDRRNDKDWRHLIRRQINRADIPAPNAYYRKRLLNIAALAVAAIQSLDRRNGGAHG